MKLLLNLKKHALQDDTLRRFVDLSKAFNGISHPILLQKLDRIGASGNVVDWFKSYLTDRKQLDTSGQPPHNLLT